MSPDFPTPETITRPRAAARSSTARAKGSFSRSAASRMLAASSRSTRRPSSISAPGSRATDGRLGEVALQHLGPHAPGLEQGLDHLADGAVAPGRARRRMGDGAYLGYRVRDREG